MINVCLTVHAELYTGIVIPMYALSTHSKHSSPICKDCVLVDSLQPIYKFLWVTRLPFLKDVCGFYCSALVTEFKQVCFFLSFFVNHLNAFSHFHFVTLWKYFHEVKILLQTHVASCYISWDPLYGWRIFTFKTVEKNSI